VIEDEKNNKELNWRVLIFLAAVILIFGILAVRLFQLQVLEAAEYATLSDQNQIRVLSQTARRGNIYDSNMVELATSKPVFCVAVTSSEIKNLQAMAETLAAILQDPDITAETIVDDVKAQAARSYEPVIVKRLDYDASGIATVSKIEENRDLLPGVTIMDEPVRYYPLGQLAGHILGTVGLISANEQEELVEKYDYLLNDWIGKTGLEKTMERFNDENGTEIGLRGKRGIQKVEVDSAHRAVQVRSSTPAISGNSLILTLDASLQQVMEDSMTATIAKLQESNEKVKAGAAVLINVKTGAILAMTSEPGLDPNDFAQGLSSDKADYYWDETLKPLFNRAISGTYPPGSTLKPATAASALAAEAIDPDFTVTCGPAMWKSPRAKCPYSHGTVDLSRAMAVSCNAYFQEIGYRTGIDKLYEGFTALGLGQKTGIELPGESAGTIANPEWKAKNFTGWESEWRSYDTFYMSMGQGYNSYTPLQLACYIAAIANDGVRMKPYLVDEIRNPDGETVYQAEPKVAAELNISQESIEAVQQAMRTVCQPGGTANSLFGSFPIAVAGKTGTAQTGLPGDDKNEDYHGLFVAFAPYDDPEIAFAGIVEYGYHGYSSAGQVCKDVFEEYFGITSTPLHYPEEGNQEDGSGEITTEDDAENIEGNNPAAGTEFVLPFDSAGE